MNNPLYLDTSGLAKLFPHESEGPILKAYLDGSEFTLVSSESAEVELIRTVAKTEIEWIQRVRDFLRGMVLLPITTSVRIRAGELIPGRTRTLDAVHLATVLEIRTDLAGLLTYDNRMAELANEAGIVTLNPA